MGGDPEAILDHTVILRMVAYANAAKEKEEPQVSVDLCGVFIPMLVYFPVSRWLFLVRE